MTTVEPVVRTSAGDPLRRHGWRPGPRVADLLVAASYTGPALVAALLDGTTSGRETGFLCVAAVASGAALLFRRRRPMSALTVTVVVMLLTFWAPGSFAAVASAMSLYAVAVHRSARQAVLALAGTSGVLVLAALLVPRTLVDLGQAGQAVVVLVIAALAGLNVRTRRRYEAALVDRSERLLREREHVATLAAAIERNAIAREMHDIVSHGLAVMISLAHGAAEITPLDPARGVDAMRQVAEAGRTAVADMRRMLGVLGEGVTGEPDGAVTPAPGFADVPALVERFGATGLPVVLRTEGEPPTDPGLQLAVYRVVQEGLTNALKHAGSVTTVVVRADLGAREIRVSVTDDGLAARGGGDRAGRGLLGMRERVALYGGTVQAGPLPGRGWSTTARFSRPEGT